jgi:membrane protease YdiL (CAAX protease family)
LFYRGLVQRSLLNRLGRPAWAIILSAMFFAFAHMQSLQFPALVVVGAVFGVLAWRSGRLGLSIFAHVGFNLTTAAVFLFDLTPPFV